MTHPNMTHLVQLHDSSSHLNHLVQLHDSSSQYDSSHAIICMTHPMPLHDSYSHTVIPCIAMTHVLRCALCHGMPHPMTNCTVICQGGAARVSDTGGDRSLEVLEEGLRKAMIRNRWWRDAQPRGEACLKKRYGLFKVRGSVGGSGGWSVGVSLAV